jgi:hypothetical protein
MAPLRAAASQQGLPLSGACPWWGRPLAQGILLEHDETILFIGILDVPSIDQERGPQVAAALGLDPAAVLLLPSGARPGPALGEAAVASLCDQARALAGQLRPARLRPLSGHRWRLAALADPAGSAWGARLERRSTELAGSRPDAALARLVEARNDRSVPPGLPWSEGMVDARFEGLLIEDRDEGTALAVLTTLRAALPAPARTDRPSAGPLHHARAVAARRLWRTTRTHPPVVAITAAISADAALRCGTEPAEGRRLGEDLGRAVADAVGAAGAPLEDGLALGRAVVRPAAAPVRGGDGQLPPEPAPLGRPDRGLPGDLGAAAALAEDVVVHRVVLGGRELRALPAQLSTGLASRVPPSVLLVGPTGGHIGAACTAREHDKSRLGPWCPWGREAGRWLLEQEPPTAPCPGALAPAEPPPVPPPVPGRQAVLRLHRHTPGRSAPTTLRLEVEWVGDPVATTGPWIALHREDGPLLWEGAPVDDLHQTMLIESRPHGDSVQWRARWSLPLPRRWSGRMLTARLAPWGLETEPRKVP